MAEVEERKQFREFNKHFIHLPADLVLNVLIFFGGGGSVVVAENIAVGQFCTYSDFQHGS